MQLKCVHKISFYVILSAAFLCLQSRPALALGDKDNKAKSLAYYTMGVVYDMQGEPEQAIKEFEKAAEFSDNYAVHLRLGADYARIGDLERAIDELNLVFKDDPENVQARYLLALIYSTQKDFDRAAQEYEKILKSFSKADPKNAEIYGYLGNHYYAQRQYKKAIEQFETILSLDPLDTDALFLLGSLYLELNNRDKASELFKRALKIDPENDPCLNSLGYMYAEDGNNLEEAQRLIERAIEIDPDNGAYLDSLGWVYYKKGQYDEALNYLLKADRYLKDPVIYEHIGDVYNSLGEVDQAKKYWAISLQMMPEQDQLKKKLNALD